MILCKDTVRFKRLTSEIIRLLPILEAIFTEYAPSVDIVITSANDSTHMPGSYHYTDYAVDVRSKALTQEKKAAVLTALQHELQPDNYDVLLEGLGTVNEHFHIEFNARKLA